MSYLEEVYQEFQLRLSIWTDIQGHLEFMYDTVLEYDAPVVIELGVQAGNSTSALLAAVMLNGGMLYSCDVQGRAQLAIGDPPGSGGLRRVPDLWWELSSYWKFLQGSDTSMGMLRRMPQGCDVLFVDTEHTAEHVYSVMEAYMPRLRPGGIALFHDTHWVPGDADMPGPSGPVATGISQYCTAHGLSWEDRPGSYGMGVIRV